MNKHNERAELIDEISVLADTLHLQPIGNDELVVLLRRAAALLSSDAQPSSPVALQWLAEMIMSDCGCSTTNQRLLERVMDRIEKYERANTTAQPAGKRGGYALAMVVLQSDLYHKLDDVERAECDALLSSDAQPTEWVGLTAEERKQAIASTAYNFNRMDVARAIEAKLKEKNHGK